MTQGSPSNARGDGIDLPRGWSVETRGHKRVTFTNADRGLELIVRVVYRGSKHQPGGRDPAHYVVRLRPSEIALQPTNETERGAKAATRREAVDVAESFMKEFSHASA